MSETPSSLRSLLAEILTVPPERITSDAGPGSIPTWDSFRHLQIVLALESEYEVQFDPARIAALASVMDLMNELRSLGVNFSADNSA